MRRPVRLAVLLVAAVALVGASLIAGPGGGTAARSRTSQADSILVETLGYGLPVGAPGRGLLLERITLAPDVALPTHAHPGVHVVFVESGELSVAIVGGFAEVTWAEQTTSQLVGAGEQVVLRAGDSLFKQRSVVLRAVNPSSTPAVLLAASLPVAGALNRPPTDDQGTPEPSWRPGQRP